MEHKGNVRAWVLAIAVGLLVVGSINFLIGDDTLLGWSNKVEDYIAVPATLVPVCYFIFFPWWRSPLGRALWIKALSLLVVFDLAVTFRWWGAYLPVGHTAFDAYLLIAIGITYQLIVMVKIWWATRKERSLERYRAYASYDDRLSKDA